MNLSIVHCRSVTSIGVLGLLVGSLNCVILAEETTSQGLRVTVSPTTGDYAIGQLGTAADVLTASVAAKVDGRWLHARDYPKHSIAESIVNDDLGTAHEWTVRHSGLEGAPELICTLHSYRDKPFGDIQVQVLENAGRTIHIQAIRPIEARQNRILDLGGPAALDRVLSDSFSEDRPALKIRDLGDVEGMHRGVGSQLLYNRQSHVSFFVGALTSNRFLTVSRLHVGGSLNAPQIEAFEVDSTGTTELTKENSLKQSPSEDQMELSLAVAPGAALDSERLFFGVSGDYHSQLETYGSLIRVLHHALDIGVNFWDTAETYGPFTNEELIGRALAGKRREDVIIATKFAWKFGPNNEQIALDSSPANIKQSIEGSLRRLKTSYIDLYYQHRLDPNTPIEDTIGAMADLVKQGKVRHIGLSEVGPGIIRRAHKVHPLSAVQSEYSLWTRGVEEKVLPTLRELGIGLVAYSPIGRGFLSGKIKSLNDLSESDWRRNNPRFQGENFQQNFKLAEIVQKIASANHATAAQVALAWVLLQGNDIVPIPGTRHIEYLNENVKAVGLKLPESAWSELDREVRSFRVVGARYPEAAMKMLDTTD